MCGQEATATGSGWNDFADRTKGDVVMDRSGWIVAEVAPTVVAPLIRAGHYLHRMPAIPMCALALTADGWIQGALIWALPPRETIVRYQGETWELARLWLSDVLPRNSESWFIGRAIRHLKSHHPQVQCLVTYADPSVGHEGIIYKATNWQYEGLTDQDRKTPRSDYYSRGKRLGRASHVKGDVVRRARVPKHRFSMRLS